MERELDLTYQPRNYLEQENNESLLIQRKATKAKRKPETSSKDSLEVQALFSMQAFVELLGYHGGWGNFSECHSELCNFLTSPQTDEESKQRLFFQGQERGAKLRRLVLMPRGHLKSTIGTTLYVMWRLYRNPELRIFVGSNKQTLSYSFIRELRQYYENEELQKKVWNNRPHLSGALVPELNTRSRQRNRNEYDGDTDATDRKLIWNNTALQMIRQGKYKEPSITAGSVGSPITGQHYDLVILDDLVDFKNTESEVRKERVEEWIQDIENVLNQPKVVQIPVVGNDTVGGEMVISGTRYAVDDYYGFLLEKQEELDYVSHIRNIYKNGIDDKDGFLWHERYNVHSVQMLRARLSPRRFSSQYLNTVYEKDVNLLDLSNVLVISNDSVYTQGERTFVTIDRRTEEVKPIVVVDPAFSANKDGDDCAIVCGCKLNDGRYVVIDAAVERMEAAEVVKTVVKFCLRYNTLRMYHESNGVGMLVPELFKTKESTVNDKRIVVHSHYEQRPKEGKIQGVLELPFVQGKMIFTEKVWDEPRLHLQLKNYPAVRHDDYLDALVTLVEKTVPNRTKGVDSRYTKGLQFSSLNIDYALETTSEQERTMLGKYNEYFK